MTVTTPNRWGPAPVLQRIVDALIVRADMHRAVATGPRSAEHRVELGALERECRKIAHHLAAGETDL